MLDRSKIFEIGPCSHLQNYVWEVSFLKQRYDLQYIAAGGVFLEFEGQRYELEAGSCWVNLPNIHYNYKPLEKYGSWDHRFISFQGEVCQSWEALGLFPKVPCSI